MSVKSLREDLGEDPRSWTHVNSTLIRKLVWFTLIIIYIHINFPPMGMVWSQPTTYMRYVIRTTLYSFDTCTMLVGQAWKLNRWSSPLTPKHLVDGSSLPPPPSPKTAIMCFAVGFLLNCCRVSQLLSFKVQESSVEVYGWVWMHMRLWIEISVEDGGWSYFFIPGLLHFLVIAIVLPKIESFRVKCESPCTLEFRFQGKDIKTSKDIL